MASIDTYLNQIRTAVYGRDVRSAIANGIEECYNRDQAIASGETSKVDGISGAAINRFAVCSNTAATTTKTVTITSGTITLEQGVRVTVLFMFPNR